MITQYWKLRALLVNNYLCNLPAQFCTEFIIVSGLIQERSHWLCIVISRESVLIKFIADIIIISAFKKQSTNVLDHCNSSISKH